jgi:hypothetical protein
MLSTSMSSMPCLLLASRLLASRLLASRLLASRLLSTPARGRSEIITDFKGCSIFIEETSFITSPCYHLY